LEPLICPTRQAEYFLDQDWTTQISLKLLDKFAGRRTRYRLQAHRERGDAEAQL
jgi:hypothetical protein